jgi:predicted esterase
MKFHFAYSLSLIIVLTNTSCFRLDDNLFNPNTVKITEYKFDSYEGPVDFTLGNSYTIPDSLIHLMTLNSGGNTLYAVYIGNKDRIATDTVILYCHGNRDHMDFYWQRAKLLANTGGKNRYGVMMVDYRGYGLSEGEPSEEGLFEDVDASLKWLKEKGLSSNRLIMYGFSLGSAPATKLTTSSRALTPSKLILEAPFASAEVMVQDASGMSLPGEFFTDLKINNADLIQFVSQPFCWIHGTDDSFLSYTTHGKVVYDRYRGSYKEAHPVSGADHGNAPLVMGFKKYSTALENFITK